MKMGNDMMLMKLNHGLKMKEVGIKKMLEQELLISHIIHNQNLSKLINLKWFLILVKTEIHVVVVTD